MIYRFGLLVATIMLILAPQKAWACTSPASTEGGIDYDVASDTINVCDGTSWIPLLTGNTLLWSSGAGDAIYYDTGTYLVGIGTSTPASALHVVGDAQISNFLKMDGVAGNAPNYGTPSMVLDDLTNVSVAAPTTNHVLTWNGTNWVAQAAGGGGLFTDNTTHITRENFHILDAGLAAGSTTASLDGDGTYSFYDPDKGAIRGGTISGGNDAWQDTNIGTNSFAWGLDNEASGNYSAVGGGRDNTANGTYSVIAGGFDNTANGTNSTIAGGRSNSSDGLYSLVIGGRSNTASGAYSNTVGGSFSTASGYGSSTFGYNAQAGTGVAQGLDANSDVGNYSMAFGLGVASTATIPQVSGNESAAFFFGDQQGEDITATNVLALEGGSLLLSNDSGTACAANKQGALRLDAAATGLEMCDGAGTWAAFGGGGSSLFTDNTTHITRETFHIIDAGSNSTAAGLDGDGIYSFYDPDRGALRGGRISGGDTAWQAANIGVDSFAWGENARASGFSTVALGNFATASNTQTIAIGAFANASGDDSKAIGTATTASGDESSAIGMQSTASAQRASAFGFNSTASGGQSSAIGLSSVASGFGSMAYGFGSTASGFASSTFGFQANAGTGTAQPTNANSDQGNYSMAFGLGNSLISFPQVTANQSAGFFFGNQTDSEVTEENVLALVGGQLLIDGVHGGSDTNTGCIRYNDTANQLEFSNDCEAGSPTYTAFGGGGSSLFTDNTTHITRENFHILDAGLAAGSTTAGLDGDGTYAFYDPDKGAFRGGEISGGDSAWQDTNIGNYSFAWGENVQANGNLSSISGGSNNTASGFISTIGGGANNLASGSYSVVAGGGDLGAGNTASGDYTTVGGGRGNVVSELYSTIGGGFNNTASGQYNTIAGGERNTTSGNLSSVLGGREVTASGYSSTGFGHQVQVGTGTGQINDLSAGQGNYSVAFGLGLASTVTFPQVSGNESAAFFFGDQQGEDITATNVLALEGGSLLLSNDSGSACAANKQGALRLDAAATGLEICDGAGTWAAFGGGSSLWTAGAGDDIYYNTGTPEVGIGTASPTQSLEIGAGNILVTDGAISARGTGATNLMLTDGVYTEAQGLLDTGALNNPAGGDTFVIGEKDNAHMMMGKYDSTNSNFHGMVQVFNDSMFYGYTEDWNDSTSIGGNSAGMYTDNGPLALYSAGSPHFKMNGPVYTYNQANAGTSQSLEFVRARGTSESTAPVVAGDEIAALEFRGHWNTGVDLNSSSSGDDVSASIEVYIDPAASTIADNRVPGEMRFRTRNDAGTVADRMTLTSAGELGIGTGAPGQELEVNGDVLADSYLHTSDERLKSNIEPVSGLELINQLRGVTFTFTEDKRESAGVIAQDVQKVLPRAVIEGEDGFLSVAYDQLIAPLIESVKELHLKITSNDRRITVLENENRELKSELEILKERLDAIESNENAAQ